MQFVTVLNVAASPWKNLNTERWWVVALVITKLTHALPLFFPPSPCRVTWCTTWAWAITCSPWILSSVLSARKAHGRLLGWTWLTLTLTAWKSECLKALQSQKSRWNAALFIFMGEAGPWQAQVCPGPLSFLGLWLALGERCVCDWVWLSYWVRRGGPFDVVPVGSPNCPYYPSRSISGVSFSCLKVSWFGWLHPT